MPNLVISFRQNCGGPGRPFREFARPWPALNLHVEVPKYLQGTWLGHEPPRFSCCGGSSPRRIACPDPAGRGGFDPPHGAHSAEGPTCDSCRQRLARRIIGGTIKTAA